MARQYKVFSKSRNTYQSGATFRGNCWSGTKARVWKTFSSIIDRLEFDILQRSRYYGSRDLSQEDLNKIDDIEIVEYEVVLQEVGRLSVKDIIVERERMRRIRQDMGYKVARMYQKMREENLQDFRYIIAFDEFHVFPEVKKRLKELDILHKGCYRFTNGVIIFKNKEDAIITKLTFADEASEVYDLELFKTMNVMEEKLKRDKTGQ